ncbi:hypothetical protein NDI76_02910 [Halogeometricum sp. S1BR25-6]|uniref:Lipoprotein n=1 Tax=Halogeometricum salsisoli TaxID=2950536 RepID=A0ABU2GA75_9EURY|nr:hypothetical protein [Halogeometricum sp. S1BR25-6]MDS0297690.1 hypothetical protein [Halogeometricum sp. S1BR25-6]
MSPSRRATLGLLGSATVALIAGCAADGSPNPTETRDAVESTAGPDSGAETDAEPSGTAGAPAAFEMRLVGPETDRVLFTGADVARVGEAQRYQTSYGLPITLDDDATERIGDDLSAAGVNERPEAFEFVLRRDGEERSRFGIARNLATDMADGEWNGEFVLMTEDEAAAENLEQALRSK